MALATVTDTSSFTPAQQTAFNAAASLSGGAATSTTNPNLAINAPAPVAGTPKAGAPNPLPGQMQQGLSGGTPTPPPPPMTSISNPVVPPTTATSTPTPPPATAPTVADQLNTSISGAVATQTQQLQQSLQTQTTNYQTQIDNLNQQKTNIQGLIDNGMVSEQNTLSQEAGQKQAALDQEQAQFKQNFEARTQLVGQLQTLLSRGQSIIEGIRNTSGLSSIMNARVSQTMADVQGQAGVITATLSAYDQNIGLAQTQLKDTTDAITSIYGDQITYWKNVIDFYTNQKTDVEGQVAKLTGDQKTYVDAQIKILQDKQTQAQETMKTVQDAMLDPQKALAFSRAGVSLTDTPEQINQKLGVYEQAQQNAWGEPHLVGDQYVQTNKLTGETRTVANTNTKVATPGGVSGANSKGKLSSKQFVELSLQRAGIKYEDALSKIPAGKVGVIDNATGQVGSINPTEYNTKQYTYL